MTREFILNTLLEYKQDPSKCAINDLNCMYLDQHTGNKCAVGKHLVNGGHQNFPGGVDRLFSFYDPEKILTKEAFDQKIPNEIWELMQNYHDVIAYRNYKSINKVLNTLESYTNFKFPELRYEKTI